VPLLLLLLLLVVNGVLLLLLLTEVRYHSFATAAAPAVHLYETEVPPTSRLLLFALHLALLLLLPLPLQIGGLLPL
jgi:hypothetical protein